MSGNNATLKETLREVVGETPAPATSEGAKETQSGETKSGETPEYVAGIDISDIPEQDRPRIKQKLEDKLKLLEKGYQPKFQKVAKLEKSLEWLASKGVTPEKAEAIILKTIEQGENPAEMNKDKKEAVKTLDSLIQNAPYEQRESLQQMRKIILEETNADKLEKKLDSLEKKVAYFEGRDFQAGEATLMSDLKALEGKFGKDIVEKYQDTVIAEWKRYPTAKAKDILKYVVPDEEYEQAILSRNTRKSEKAKAVSSNGAGVASSTEVLDVKGFRTHKDLLRQLIRKNKE